MKTERNRASGASSAPQPPARPLIPSESAVAPDESGLHAAPRSRNNPLGVLSELIGKDSKSPLIVVVDSNNNARTLDDEMYRGHSKSSYSHRNHNHAKSRSPSSNYNYINRYNYEDALYDLLRTSQLALENQEREDRFNMDRQLDQCSGEEDKGKGNGGGNGGSHIGSAEKCTVESEGSCEAEKQC